MSLPASAVQPLVKAFPEPDYYLQEDAILDALRHRSMFNLLDLTSGDKVDFWILTEEPFDLSRFARKRVEDALGFRVSVSAPEDTILMKLRWSQMSGVSEKQFGDARGVYEVQRESLDRNYINDWAKRLGVEALWHRLQSEAEPA